MTTKNQRITVNVMVNFCKLMVSFKAVSYDMRRGKSRLTDICVKGQGVMSKDTLSCHLGKTFSPLCG